jgi:cytochrome c oxidase subunit 1
VPLVTFGAITAAIIAVFTIASGADHPDPDLADVARCDGGRSAGLPHRLVGFGHSSQQINVAAHISIWYLVAAVAFGAKPMSERVSRTAFLLYILFLQLASAHHLLADPGLSTGWKVVNTSYFMYFAVLASMLHGLTIPARWKSRSARRATTRVCSSGCARRPGATRRSPACSSRSSASASSAASPA